MAPLVPERGGLARAGYQQSVTRGEKILFVLCKDYDLVGSNKDQAGGLLTDVPVLAWPRPVLCHIRLRAEGPRALHFPGRHRTVRCRPRSEKARPVSSFLNSPLLHIVRGCRWMGLVLYERCHHRVHRCIRPLQE